jgi:ABC-type Fe3+ transport system permease subunit
MAPFILPGTVVSVALLSAFSGNSLIKLTGTYTIIVISYMVRRTPYVYRSVAASLSQLNPSLEEHPQSLGQTGSTRSAESVYHLLCRRLSVDRFSPLRRCCRS